ncbi:ectonucleotide pyrophosphatase/phosphodiesterase [Brevundimonas aurifodinae]|uniref:Ectonucleotide pyrophosphatase/phosphodiesterase n=2 Tax=Brevundimonas TaxID=41275 RepID=A0ABV1NPU2_9CAUL|nr:MAG: alkaline phosphatase family protein [Brevundimonas sp. 12-68-7]OYX32901.1 MAG: alkaline phosphatase family protein [Brevundimonas subvibrioides]
MSRALIVCLTLLLAACATSRGPQPDIGRPLTVLISIDGFRTDYLSRGDTPTLSALAAEGATGSMRPSYPSVTFPNHYTLVTGRHPDHHGIVGNSFIDPVLGRFTMANKEPRFWDQAEPIWITAEKAGLTTATMFWPGSETELQGERPTYWAPFDQAVTGDQRVDRLLGWLDATPRPDLSTLYFDTVDTVGHSFGPDTPEVDRALTDVDASVARLIAGLQARGLWERTHLIVVSDHGMAQTSPERVTHLDDLVDPAFVQIIYSGSAVFLEPTAGREDEVRRALVRRHAHGECWTRETIPARFVLGTNPRVPSIVCAADVGWLFVPRTRTVTRVGGAHGYDNAAPEMQALFIAHGPDIARGVTLRDMDSVDVQPLLGRLLGIEVPPGDGRAEDGLAAMSR